MSVPRLIRAEFLMVVIFEPKEESLHREKGLKVGLPLFNSYEEVSKSSSRAKSVNPDNVRNVKDDKDSFKDITFSGHGRSWRSAYERADVGLDLIVKMRMCQCSPHGWVYILVPNQKKSINIAVQTVYIFRKQRPGELVSATETRTIADPCWMLKKMPSPN